MQWGGGAPMSTDFTLPVVERFCAIAKAARPSILWSSHQPSGFEEKAAQVRPGSPANPFVMGRAKVARSMEIVLACKRAVTAG